MSFLAFLHLPSGADFDIDFVDVYLRSKIGSILVCKDGSYYEFDEDMAAEILTDDEIFVDIDLNQGLYDAKAWGCDLSYEYIYSDRKSVV